MPDAIETFQSITFEWLKLFKYEIIFFRFAELYVVCVYRNDINNNSSCFTEFYLNKDDYFPLQEQCHKLIPHPSVIKKTISPEETKTIYNKHYLMDTYWQQNLLSDYIKGQSVIKYCEEILKDSVESVFDIISAVSRGVCQFDCDDCQVDIADDIAYHCQQCFELDDDGYPIKCFDLCPNCFINGISVKEHQENYPDHQLIQRQMINVL